MQLFEEPIGDLCTDGPAVVLKVEQRKEPRFRSVWDTRGVEWVEFGVVIYTARGKATPVQRNGEWGMPESATVTRFIRVADHNGSCAIPPEAGRLLGHFRQDGQKWWVFLEKVGASAAPSPPVPGERPRSAAQSPAGKAAPSASSVPPRQPAAPQASRPQGKPDSTSAPGGR